MTQSLIWIQVLPVEEISYSSGLCDWAKKTFPGLTVFDFDNHSEGFIVDQAIEQAGRSDKLVLLIHAGEGIAAGPVTRFLNRLSRNRTNQVLILFDGKNEMIEKMIRIIDGGFIDNPGEEEQKRAIRKFLEA